jgi:hypothetical protein
MSDTLIIAIVFEIVGFGLKHLLYKTGKAMNRLNNSEDEVLGIGQFAIRLAAGLSIVLIFAGIILFVIRILIEFDLKPF